MRLRRLFATTSVAFLAVLAVSPAKNALRSFHALQREYRRLGRSRAKSLRAAAEYDRQPPGIRQIWLPEFENRIDRCATCHLGVADAAMDSAAEPFRRHPATAHTPNDFDRFGCTSCHGGQGLATSKEDAHGVSGDSGASMLPALYLEAGCGRCHTAESVPEAEILSRGRAVMARSGCYACHAVRGHEQFRSEAPPLTSTAVKTGGLWLARWLKDPKSVDPNATMPNFELSVEEIRLLSHYLFSREVPRSLADRVARAEREPSGDPAAGKKVFSEARCITCHTVEGKGNGSAPELSKVATSATRGWLLEFVRDPHAFNPKTRMPQYHLSEVESRDLVAYLEQDFRDFEAPKDILEPIRVNQTLAEEGQKLFRRFGCFSCHDPSLNSGPERFGPDLNGIGDKKAASLDFGRRSDLSRSLPAWLSAKIESPRSFAQGLKMPKYGFSPADARAVVTALLSLSTDAVPDRVRPPAPPPVVLRAGGPVGALLDRYRCLSCHQIGTEGGDISTAPLTFEGSKVKREWLADYLVLSFTIRPILEERMPVFRMPREEAAVLAGAIESFFVDPSIPEDPFAGRPESDGSVPEGERLYVSNGCRACHIIGSSGGYYGPPLTDAGKRLKPGWVFRWLKGPQAWRADVRCPNYGFTDTDALRLTAYVGSLAASSAPTGSR